MARSTTRGRGFRSSSVRIVRIVRIVQTRLERIRVVCEAECAGVGRSEHLASLSGVGLRDKDIDSSQAIDGQAVRFAQRLTSLGGLNSGRFEKCSNLLRLDLTAGDEHALQL